MSWKRPLGCGRTRIGCTTPLATMDAASSASSASSTCDRVWNGLRSISSIGISRGLPLSGSLASERQGCGRLNAGQQRIQPLPRARRLVSGAAMLISIPLYWPDLNA